MQHDGSDKDGDAAHKTHCDALKKTVAATGKIVFFSHSIIDLNRLLCYMGNCRNSIQKNERGQQVQDGGAM